MIFFQVITRFYKINKFYFFTNIYKINQLKLALPNVNVKEKFYLLKKFQ